MILRVISLSMLFLAMPAGLRAQDALSDEDAARQVHWAAAAFFGTGWYQVDENRSMFIFRIPPRQRVREAGWHEDGRRRLGVEIQYPLALGMHRLDDIPDFIEFDNYGTITFTPGVQVEVPVNDRWSLRPYGHIGVGYERETGEWARIFYGGLKSRYLLGESERLRWSLLSGLYFAGYKPEYEDRGEYGSVMAGLEFNQPLRRWAIGDDPIWLNWHVTYNYMFDKLQFHTDEENFVTVDDQWELGLAFGLGDKRLKFWFLSFEQVGLSFKTSSNGAYQAISLNFRSPFTY